MIVYQSGMFGLRNLLRMHGSPVYKVIIPTAFSTGFLLLLHYVRTNLDDERSVQHPYSIGAFIGFFSFLLTCEWHVEIASWVAASEGYVCNVSHALSNSACSSSELCLSKVSVGNILYYQ